MMYYERTDEELTDEELEIGNKSEWGEGPWQNEPDRLEWIDESTGYPCLARRNMGGGFWCGYVGIPKDHSLHGKGRDAPSELDNEGIDVHGGVTYSNKCDGDPEDGICHKSDKDDVWWLGFDCAHYPDYMPSTGMLNYNKLKFIKYKNLEFVKQQCASMANQLKTKENEPKNDNI